MELKGKTLMVTGSGGFVGSQLIKQLEREDPKEILKFDLTTGQNLTEYRELEVFFKDHKVDIVYDMATIALPASLTHPYKVVNDCCKMILNLCELQRLGAFSRLVHMSSSEAYGTASVNAMDENHSLRPRTPYAAGKAAGDLICMSYVYTFKNDIIIPRSYNVYGPYQPLHWGAVIPKTIWNILNGGKPVIYKDGTQTRDFVYIEDSVKAVILISKLNQSGIVVNIGTGIETPINKLVTDIVTLMNYEGEIDYQEQRAADVSRHCANANELFRLTGYRAETKLADGLRKTIEYYIKLHSNQTIRS
jgi:UDP-glucose 4-epimerase